MELPNSKIMQLKQLFADSLLSELFSVRKEDELERFSSLRFKSNDLRIRAIEIWDNPQGQFFRVYHGSQIADEVKILLQQVDGLFNARGNVHDFRGDFSIICKQLKEVLSSDTALAAAKANPVYSRNSGYEGLSLPDVDTADDTILGRTFTWKEILAIHDADDDNLKKALSQSGVYLQRSADGTARYVGSAYGTGGLLGRWIRHLGSNGDAKHLNFYILENGYNNVLFTVLEITPVDNALSAETRWKTTLGTYNAGPYNGKQLNCN
ncbi:GIY-YIG nuclease family protein [Rheinheimera sp.]|jgi:hypothetical protein|uniref:GIY-YIG nuclease family protein n=1 Tax=Rheinheimera sp. TaxID=1869214 RepID=UPI003D28D9E4